MKRALLIPLVCIIFAAACLLIRSLGNGQEQLLPDGSKLRLTAVKLGATNTFHHGRGLDNLVGATVPDRLVRRFIPRQGLRLWRFTLLQCPRSFDYGSPLATTLTAQFRLQPVRGLSTVLCRSKLEIGESDVNRNYRWIIQGDDERRFMYGFGLRRLPEGFFSYVSTTIFPRNARYLTFYLEEADPAGATWHQVAAFRVKNPSRGGSPPWPTSARSLTRRIEDLEFTLGPTSVRADPTQPNDLWRYSAEFPFQVKRNGVVETNWNADHFRFEDASGNADELMGSTKTTGNGWLTYEPCPSLDPKVVWRISADFGLDSGWPATNRHVIQVAVPQSPPIRTNLQGLPLEISLSGDWLFVQTPTNRTDLRLAFICAVDKAGRNVAHPATSWTQHRFPAWLDLPVSGGAVDVTIAIDRIYRVEFCTKPVWKSARPDQ